MPRVTFPFDPIRQGHGVKEATGALQLEHWRALPQ